MNVLFARPPIDHTNAFIVGWRNMNILIAETKVSQRSIY